MSDERWTFGERPLAETRELATLVRDISGHALALEQSTDTLRDLVAHLRVVEARLRTEVPANPRPRIADRDAPDRRVYLDHSRDIGEYNAGFPVYELRCAADRAEGRVEFPIVYEGPPGGVHGGTIALLFDCVLQQLNCDLGVAGRTTALEVSYRRPTPLLTPLDITATRELVGRRIHSHAQLHRGDDLLCEARMTSVAGSLDDLPAVSPRRAS
jgi:acyl-coenzyme A thioesterase PaaI-like protein